jgi:hypothetical protein
MAASVFSSRGRMDASAPWRSRIDDDPAVIAERVRETMEE